MDAYEAESEVLLGVVDRENGPARLRVSQSGLGKVTISGESAADASLALLDFGRPSPVLNITPTAGAAPRITGQNLVKKNLRLPAGTFDLIGGPVEVVETALDTACHVEVEYYLSGVLFLTDAGVSTALTVGDTRFELRLLGTTDEIRERLREHGYGVPTAVLETSGVPLAALDQVDEMVSRLCWLTTYAMGNGVGDLRRVVKFNGNIAQTRLRNGSPRRHGMPTPLFADGAKFRRLHKFLENCFQPYVAAESTLPIARLTHMVTLARAERVMEIRAMTLCTFLEVCRYQHGLRLVAAGVAKRSGDFFRRVGEHHNLSFVELLQDFATNLRVSGVPWKRIRDFRNSVVHQGEIPGGNHTEKRQRIGEALHLADMFILALLDWDAANGEYRPAHAPNLEVPGEWGVNIIPFTRVWP